MRVFVTGASGFIGQRLVQILTQRGDTVHALCRKRSPGTILPEGVSVFEGDILDPPSTERAMTGCEGVLHVAGYAKNWARDPQDFYTVNVRGTQNVMQAALKLKVKRAVYTSSAMTLGPSNGVPLHENSLRTAPVLTDYEASKLEAEELVRTYARQGLEVAIVSPTRVHGPGLLTEGNSLTRMFKLYLEGKYRVIPGDGEALGNYAFLEDVARGHLLALERGTPGEQYTLGGENVSYNTLFTLVASISGRHHRLVHLPGNVLVGVSAIEECRARWFRGYPAITPGWMKTFLLDAAYSCSKAERDLGYHITPLTEALQVTLDWLKASPSNRDHHERNVHQ